MKTIKIMTLLTVVFLFTSIPYTVNAGMLRDCDNLRKFSHKWNMCKLGSTKYDSEYTITEKKQKKMKKAEVEKAETKKEKKGFNKSSFWEKLKNMGGTNIGEPG